MGAEKMNEEVFFGVSLATDPLYIVFRIQSTGWGAPGPIDTLL